MWGDSISSGRFLRNLHGHGPARIVRVLPAGRFEVQLLQAFRDGSHFSRPDRTVVYLLDGCDLETGTREKNLVGGIELGAPHVARVVGMHPELLLGQLYHRVT